jgi:hypothetical protein
MAKPCQIADTVCVQPGRKIVVLILCLSTCPEGCPSDPLEGLSKDLFGETIRGIVQMPPEGQSKDLSGETI